MTAKKISITFFWQKIRDRLY